MKPPTLGEFLGIIVCGLIFVIVGFAMLTSHSEMQDPRFLEDEPESLYADEHEPDPCPPKLTPARP